LPSMILSLMDPITAAIFRIECSAMEICKTFVRTWRKMSSKHSDLGYTATLYNNNTWSRSISFHTVTFDHFPAAQWKSWILSQMLVGLRKKAESTYTVVNGAFNVPHILVALNLRHDLPHYLFRYWCIWREKEILMHTIVFKHY
jgi:hypothetical protein